MSVRAGRPDDWENVFRKRIVRGYRRGYEVSELEQRQRQR